MNYFEDCLTALAQEKTFDSWLVHLESTLQKNIGLLNHGHLAEWQAVVNALPDIQNELSYSLADIIRIGSTTDISHQTRQTLEQQLMGLCPWRKGPYEIFGVHIDTEWRSDWKWQRLQHAIQPLQGHRVLDVGCGSGYHLWRMREAGAKFVLGIDPSLLFWQQFLCIKKYLQKEPVHFLPLRSEDLPEQLSAFDTVFSMGVLYHRRSPLDHLIELRNVLKPEGQLVLETLIINQANHNVLFPKDRYAQMRNVFFLPSIDLLKQWLERLGFINIEVLDINQTSIEEQRVTPWVKAQSLKDFLDPQDSSLTIEGYPAPLRATLRANKDARFQ